MFGEDLEPALLPAHCRCCSDVVAVAATGLRPRHVPVAEVAVGDVSVGGSRSGMRRRPDERRPRSPNRQGPTGSRLGYQRSRGYSGPGGGAGEAGAQVEREHLRNTVAR